MTRTYNDVEAVSRLLQEKEKDLELAAKIGQELLERNKYLDERVAALESSALFSSDLLTQLRHDLTIKTELLRVYTNDETGGAHNDSSPEEMRNVNVELLRRRIKDLEDENKKLQEEASELSKEAYEFEEKEEKLVSDAVKHLTEANVQISYLNEEFTVKQDESFKQKEEITHLLAQVCDLQVKLRKFSQENEDLNANVLIYKETQDELTKELAEFKEKYREVVDLLKDAQEELKISRKKGAYYPGIGSHSLQGMFSSENESSSKKGKGDSLLDEIHNTLKASRRTHADVSAEEIEFSSRTGSGSNQYLSGGTAYNRAFNTYRYANQASSGSYLPRSASENPYGSYTISRDNSCLDLMELGHMGKDHMALNQTKSIYGSSMSLFSSPPIKEASTSELVDFEIKKEGPSRNVQTVGELSLPTAKSNRNLRALAMPLGYVPGQDKPASITSWLESSPDIPGGVPLGSVPTKPPVLDSVAEAADESGFLSNTADCKSSHLSLPPESLPVGLLGSVPGGAHQPDADHENSSESDVLESTSNLTLPPESLPVGFLGSAPLGSVPGFKAGDHEELETTSGLTLPPQSLPLGILGSAPLGSVPGFTSNTKDMHQEEDDLLEPAFSLTLHRETPPPLGGAVSVKEGGNAGGCIKPERSASSAITGSWDSGVLSGDYNEVRGGAADGFSEAGDIEFCMPTQNGELERALRKLNPLDIEKRRKKLKSGGPLGSFDLGSEGYGSPPAQEEDEAVTFSRANKFNLPYGVQTPDSLYSSCSKDWNGVGRRLGSGGPSGNNWRVPNKLRIVKPLEGSLTLHNWSQLAQPSLGGILEEKSGIVIKGGNIMGISSLEEDEFEYSDFGENLLPRKHGRNIPDTQTRQTLTDSTVIHPENPETTSTYSEYQLASGFRKQQYPESIFGSSRFSSRFGSATDLRVSKKCSGLGTSTFSTNIGIASVLNERNIHGGSELSLYEPSLYEPSLQFYEPSIVESSFYEPSLMGKSRIGTRRASLANLNDVLEEYKGAYSPTVTPKNSPMHSPPSEPSGFVSSIFASLKASIYGPSKRIKQPKGGVQKRRKGFGILKRVEEVGVDNLLLSHSSSRSSLLEDMHLGDCDELQDILPGSLTLLQGRGSTNSPPPLEILESTADLSGVLVAPAFSTFGRPSLNRAELGTVPDKDEHVPGILENREGLRAGGDLGVPGIPGTDALDKLRPDLGSVPENLSPITLENRSMKNSSSVMGNITSMFFGRKGGLL